MNNSKFLTLFLTVIMAMPLVAFSADDERIDSYIELLAKSGMEKQKQKMVESLQRSGLSDPRLFDQIENHLLESIELSSSQIGSKRKLITHMLLSLGYSGNEKYRPTLTLYTSNDTVNGRFRRYANKGLKLMTRFRHWHKLIATSEIGVEGKSIEIATYMKMLNTDDVYVQRWAARAIFEDSLKDPDLLALAAEKLEEVYLENYLDGPAQDTAAWFCKAIGLNGGSEYNDLLRRVAKDSPHKKLKRYASKYVKQI